MHRERGPHLVGRREWLAGALGVLAAAATGATVLAQGRARFALDALLPQTIAGLYDPTALPYGEYGSYWPGPDTSGIPAHSPALTLRTSTDGIHVITAPGRYDLVDFHCEVQIRCAGVVFTRCRFRGNATRTTNGGLANLGALAPYGTGTLATFYDCEFSPDTPSVWWDAIMSHDYTAHRCKVSRCVDGFGVFGNGPHPANVALYGCYVDKHAMFSPDPNHPDDTPVSKTHNDSVQWNGGAGLTLVGNSFAGYDDPAVGDAARPAGAPNKDGGYNVYESDLATRGAYLINGANLQISGTVGGPCTGLVAHDNLFSGASRAVTISQAYAELGVVHDNTFTGDYRAGVAANIPTGMDGGDGSGRPLQWYGNVDLLGRTVPLAHT